MTWVIFFVCLIPAIYEAYTDRFGESKKDKIIDGILLVAGSLVIAGVSWWFGQNPLSVLLLIFAWRVLLFNQVVNWFLKRYSGNHNDINIWTYIGTTSPIDKIISKVNPVVRLAVRVVVFGFAVWWFLS